MVSATDLTMVDETPKPALDTRSLLEECVTVDQRTEDARRRLHRGQRLQSAPVHLIEHLNLLCEVAFECGMLIRG